MWKDKNSNERIAKFPERKPKRSLRLPLVYQTYSVNGANVDYFINKCAKKGITLINVKKTSVNGVVLTIKLNQTKKFFAINKDLCYNIKKIKSSGLLYPVYYLSKNIGLVLGALVFAIVSFFASDLIFGFSYIGTGAIYSQKLSEYLNVKGVKVYSRFSEIDLKSLQNDILRESPYLTFASCEKQGNRLIIRTELAEIPTQRLEGNVKELRADVDGVVELVKVYRGTATVSVGDQVNSGDLLVDGYALIKEQILPINVIAEVTLKANCFYEYFSPKDNLEEQAQVFAEVYFADRQAKCSKVEKITVQGGFKYKVTLDFLRIYCVG